MPSGKETLPRSQAGPYQLTEVLGRGGMGLVYRGHKPGGEPVAIKVLRTDAARFEDGWLQRFRREASIRIEHPNVVRVIEGDVDPDDGSPYIVFEFLEGDTLLAHIRRARLSVSEVVEVGIQTCAGLAAVHEAGIVHRDLKPANLFVCTDGKIKLLDFGIARCLDHGPEHTVLTAVDHVMGTPGYLAPEQARGDEEVDARTDLWSLGVVLYEALAGKRPFRGDAQLSVMLAIVLQPPTPLTVHVPSVPPEVDALIMRCLRKAREERFQDAGALRVALEVLRGTVGVVRIGADPGELLGAPMLPEEGATVVERHVPTMAPGEVRVVCLLLAEGVRDAMAVETAVCERDGVFVPLAGQRAIGLFGGEAWEGDEVMRAASAALQVRPSCDAVGVASGRAQQLEHGISGAVVRAAELGCRARLEGVAVSEEAKQVLRGGFALRPAGKGFHELTADRPPYWPLSPGSGEQGVVPTVGREPELEHVRDLVDRFVGDRGSEVAFVVGPPGIGKSRIREEAERRLEEISANVTLRAGRAEPLHRRAAHSLFSSALMARARLGTVLRGWPSVEADATDEERVQGVLALVTDVLGDPKRVEEMTSFLGELLGVPMPETAVLHAARRDPQLMTDRLHLAVLDYFDAACGKGPVALLLEDLQWADEASMDLLGELLEAFSDRELLFLGTGRPEVDELFPDLFAAGRQVHRIELRGLHKQAAGELAQAIVERPLGDALLDALYERTGGNPLFIEQIANALRDATEPLGDDLPLPLSVEAAVQSRLDHLPREEKELCKRASVFGRPFDVDELAALGVRDTKGLLSSLARRDVTASRVRARGRRGGAREYRFRSALVSDIAYKMLGEELRTMLHRLAAEHLAARAESKPEEVAYHFERGSEKERAAEYYAMAALAAERRGDSHTVLRCAERSLALGAPEHARFGLYMAQADVLRFLGRREEQAGVLGLAIVHASTDAERARVFIEQAVWLSRTGRNADALDTAQRAVEAAKAAHDDDLLALAFGREATMLAIAGSIPEAEDALSTAERLAAQAPPRIQAFLAEWRGQLGTSLGELGMQIDAYLRASTAYEEAGDLRRAAAMDTNVADAYNRVGAFAEAEVALSVAVERCRRIGNRLVEGYALVNLGYALAHQGRTGEALEVLEKGLERARANKDARLELFARLYRARAMVWAGVTAPGTLDRTALEAGGVAAEEVAESAAELGLPGLRVLGLAVAARTYLARGDTDEALRVSSRAMLLRDELGSIEEDEAELFLTHAAALEAAGRADEARATRERGRERLENVAASIRDEIWRQRYLEEVPAHRELRG